jgi:hypothetical protein
MLTLCVVCERMGVLICMYTHIDHVDICGHVCCVCVVFVGVYIHVFIQQECVKEEYLLCVLYLMDVLVE